MLSFLNQSVGRRILAVVGILGLLSLGGMGLFTLHHLEKSLLSQNEASLRQLTDMASQGLQTIMLAGYADVAQRYAVNLKKVNGLEEFSILRHDGKEAFQDNSTIQNVNERLGEDEFEERGEEKENPILPTDDPRLKELLEKEEMVAFYDRDALGQRTLGALVPVPNLKVCYRCHGSGHKVRGVIKLTTSLAPVEAKIRQAQGITLGVLVTVVGLFLTLLGVLLKRTVSRPLREIHHAIQEMADGNLLDRLPVSPSGDEIAGIAASVNQMADSLTLNIRTINMHSGSISAFVQEILTLRAALDQDSVNLNTIAHAVAQENTLLGGEIGKISGHVAEAADNMQTITRTATEVAKEIRGIAGSAGEASANVETMASAAEEMTANVAEVRQNLEQVHTAAAVVNREVGEMSGSLEEVRQRCANASSASGQAAAFAREAGEVMARLATSARQIGDVTKIINDIASRTNILALNAAIEAAGAGEAGLGFAVVAKEVKDLSNQTAQATRTISERIREIREHVEAATGAAGNIAGIVERINTLNQEIALSVEEQTRSIQSIGRSTTEVTGAAEAVTHNAEELSLAAQEVARSAAEAAAGTGAIASASEVAASAALKMSSESQEALEFTVAIRTAAQATGQASRVVEEKVGDSLRVVSFMQGSVRHFRSLGDVARNISDALHAAQSSLEIGQERFDIRRMKEVHLAMLGKLERAVNGSLHLNPDEMPSAEGCPLGRWLASPEARPYQGSTLLTRLQETHAQMHATAREVLELLLRERLPEAVQAVRFFHELRKTLFDQLNLLYMGQTEENSTEGPWIPWNSDLELGIPAMDEDHKALVGILNTLHEALANGKGGPFVGRTLGNLLDDVTAHFTREEGLMPDTYPERIAHQREHALFLERTQEYLRLYREENHPITPEILEFFRNWLARHIRGSDARLGAVLNRSA